jgi:hypothetical protein
MPPKTPYSAHLGNLEPIASMRKTSDSIGALTARWSSEQFERTYAPGKWTARQILTHLAETELALGYRTRMALSSPGYAAQSFDQDAWIEKESRLAGADAEAARFSMRQMNLTLFASLSPADRLITFSHPEYGALTVDWIIHMLAGHDINHLAQLERIATSNV